jgi:hypothetical protein
MLEPGRASKEGRVNCLTPQAMSAHNLLVAEPTDFCFRWRHRRHRDGSTVEFNPSGWVSTDPSKADWLVKMNELCSSKPAICPAVRFWLQEYCELIDFHCSERLEPNGARFRNKERTNKKRFFSVIRMNLRRFLRKAWSVDRPLASKVGARLEISQLDSILELEKRGTEESRLHRRNEPFCVGGRSYQFGTSHSNSGWLAISDGR